MLVGIDSGMAHVLSEAPIVRHEGSEEQPVVLAAEQGPGVHTQKVRALDAVGYPQRDGSGVQAHALRVFDGDHARRGTHDHGAIDAPEHHHRPHGSKEVHEGGVAVDDVHVVLQRAARGHRTAIHEHCSAVAARHMHRPAGGCHLRTGARLRRRPRGEGGQGQRLELQRARLERILLLGHDLQARVLVRAGQAAPGARRPPRRAHGLQSVGEKRVQVLLAVLGGHAAATHKVREERAQGVRRREALASYGLEEDLE
mmetsp:Transcript_22027/g.74082  ORF Transcript_22027/g.74082 Transcript_22027/m.74082 type:complete len:256 (-) Transcript_22027:57-824(-)